MRMLTFIILIIVSPYCIASEQLNCEKLWLNTGTIVQYESSVLVHPQIPEAGIIEGFEINILKQQNGKLFRPKNLDESICSLDAMLESKTRNAIRMGIKDFVRLELLKSSEEKFDKLWTTINNKLNELYSDSGMPEGVGINLILGMMEEQFDIRLFGGENNRSEIQIEAAKKGIMLPKSVLRWIWFSYLEYLCVEGFESKEFINFLN